MHGAELPVPDRPDRLEDRTVEDVRPHRERRLEPEDDHQDRRHQRAAAHPGHPDERADQQTGEDELPGHGATTGTPRSAPRRPPAARTRPAAARRSPSISRTFVPDRKTWSSDGVRARLRARHRAARLAPERVLEEHRLDVELVRLELVEDQLRVVGAVVAADAGVVAADDEVRAAVVLAADRVPDRLARAGVAHRRREGGDEHAVGRVVVVDAAPRSTRRASRPGRRRDFVSPTSGWISRPSTVSSATFVRYSCARWIGLRVWKPTTRLQPRSANAAPRLGRVERELGELRRRPLEHGHPAGEVHRLLLEEPRDAGMLRVGRAVGELRLALLVVVVDAPRRRGRRPACRTRRRARPGRPAAAPSTARQTGSAHGRPFASRMSSSTRLVVVPAHEALERRERARREHVEVGELARGQRGRPRATSRSSGAVAGAVDELAAVRLDQAFGRSATALTRPPAPGSGRAPRACAITTCGRLLGRLALGLDDDLGALGRLVRVVDAGEALDLAGERLRVEALDVAPRALVERGGDEDLDERAELLDQLACLLRGSRSYGEIAAAITAPPWRVRREATQPIRSMFVSRSSFEKPRPFERCVRTVSPSRYSTIRPRRSSSGPTTWAIVDLPDPERPVNQSVKPPSRTRSDSGCSWAWMFSVIRFLSIRVVARGCRTRACRSRPSGLRAPPPPASSAGCRGCSRSSGSRSRAAGCRESR